MVLGPARSGSIFHIDPNQTNAWNVCVKGRKKWIFYPPNQCPPGVVSSPDGADVTGQLSIKCSLYSHYVNAPLTLSTARALLTQLLLLYNSICVIKILLLFLLLLEMI